MDESDRRTIQSNIIPLMEIDNITAISTSLISKGMIDHEFVERIQKKYVTMKEQNEEFFLRYTRRGPDAFGILVETLHEHGYIREARLLSPMSPVVTRSGHTKINMNIGIKDLKTRPSVSSLESPSENELSSSSLSSTSNSNGILGHGGSRPIDVLVPYHLSSSLEPSSSSSSSVSGEHSGIREELAVGLIRSRSPTGDGDESVGEYSEYIPSDNSYSLPPDLVVIPIKKSTRYNEGKTCTKEAYAMMSKPRGHALIVNNINFPTSKEDNRIGADVDTNNLAKLLSDLGFNVSIYHDVKKSELLSTDGIIEKFKKQFKEGQPVDACIVAIMSHGEKLDQIRTSDPGVVHININKDIITRFNNKSFPIFYTKPKIFIMQSCRGSMKDRGFYKKTESDGKNLQVTIACDAEDPFNFHSSDESDSPKTKAPTTEDMLICYSTIPGYVANRDTSLGTWYIQCLCDVVRQYAHELEIHHILKKVSQKMGRISSEDGDKQMSSFTNLGFHRDFYFNPGLYANFNENTHQENENQRSQDSEDV